MNTEDGKAKDYDGERLSIFYRTIRLPGSLWRVVKGRSKRDSKPIRWVIDDIHRLLIDPDIDATAKKALSRQLGEREAERERFQRAISEIIRWSPSHGLILSS